MRWALALLGMGAAIFAAPASADDGSFLAHLAAPGMVHPPLSNSGLLDEGRQVCFQVRKVGLSQGAAKDAVVSDLGYRHIQTDYASAGTLVHFALQDLCPSSP